MWNISLKMFFSRFGLALGLGLLAPAAVQSQEREKDMMARGQYIFAVAGGCACHTVPKGTPHAGGRAFPIPFGKAYATNITQDKETGIGSWSDKEIRDSIVKGIRPNGERLLPIMPYEAYSGMAEEDLKALIVYLRTLKPVSKENLQPKVYVSLFRPLVTPLWLKLFGRFSNPPARAPKNSVERGRYLVEHVSLCDDCHTPRNLLMVPRRALYLAGSKVGILGEEIPNITPDKETGIGEWSRNDIAEFLMTGTKPDLDNVQGLMEEVIEAGYKQMKKEDALAIADYIKSIPPIVNKIK
ncbi:MAG: cytochrome c [Deltaproteobacteria bacterium]|nr:cytochrome c [Deltaproteobacteria bacterium]